LRPGRFDRRVVVNRPDLRGREGIVSVHTRKVPLSADVDMRKIARGTPGFSGADLANLVNEAALIAARLNRKAVTHPDFEYARDKVLMGTERRSMLVSEEEKRITAYHEAGHALVGHLLPNADPVHKVTIIPRGRAMGLTQYLPLDDRYNYNKEFLQDRIAICLGGRISEELTFKQLTTGAENDLETATELARKMVCDWGMSEELGPVSLGKKEEAIFLGREFAQQSTISPETAVKIDQEIRRIILLNYERATNLLTENRHLLEKVAEALLEYESLDNEQIRRICEGLPLESIEERESDASQKESAKVPGRPIVPVPQN
jgi:cell division protease FtsH